MSTRSLTKQRVGGLSVTEWAGPGQTVFGLPGLGSSASVWAHLAESLPDARVLAADLRGRGDSQGLAGPAGLRAHAKDVARILDELDMRDVVVVGHSMGAYLAPLVAQESPQRVARLVMVDGGIRPKFPFFMGPAMTRTIFKREMSKMDRDWPSIEAMAKAGKFDKMLASRPDLKPIVLKMLSDEIGGRPGAYRPRADVARCAEDAADTFWGDDVTGALEALKVPAHMLLAENLKWEGQKPFIRDDVVAPWTAKLPNLTVTRLTGNHVTVLFAPEVLEAVRS